MLAPVLLGAGYRLGLHVAPTRCDEINCRREACGRHPLHGWPVCAQHLTSADEAVAALAAQDTGTPGPDSAKPSEGA